ncbi:hypothetical protein FOCC_FOCC003609 [Frankliniella occidentalis]|nr:hypothetical protein FOCC_FOCC003609 [Frankliniella occidentalis]
MGHPSLRRHSRVQNKPNEHCSSSAGPALVADKHSLCLHRGDGGAVLPVLEEHHVDPLLYHGLDLLHHLVAVVADADVDGDLLAVVVQLLVQGHLQLQLAGAHHEVLAHDGARLAALLGRRVLHLPDAHGHAAPGEQTRTRRELAVEEARAGEVRGNLPAVAAVRLGLPDEDLDVVLHAAGLTLVLVPGLQGDGRGGRRGDVEGEGHGVVTELLEEPLLGAGRTEVASWRGCPSAVAVHLLRRRVDLLRGQEQVLLEVESHDLILLAAVPEGAHHLTEHLAALQVLGVHGDDAICTRHHVVVVTITTHHSCDPGYFNTSQHPPIGSTPVMWSTKSRLPRYRVTFPFGEAFLNTLKLTTMTPVGFVECDLPPAKPDQVQRPGPLPVQLLPLSFPTPWGVNDAATRIKTAATIDTLRHKRITIRSCIYRCFRRETVLLEKITRTKLRASGRDKVTGPHAHKKPRRREITTAQPASLTSADLAGRDVFPIELKLKPARLANATGR